MRSLDEVFYEGVNALVKELQEREQEPKPIRVVDHGTYVEVHGELVMRLPKTLFNVIMNHPKLKENLSE